MTTKQFAEALVKELDAIGAGTFTISKDPNKPGLVVTNTGDTHYLARRQTRRITYQGWFDEYRVGKVYKFNVIDETGKDPKTTTGYSDSIIDTAKDMERAIWY